MEVTEDNAHWFADSFTRITNNVGKALLGKEDVIRLALTCMFAEGHLLLEDAPGTGKTALARAIAATVHGTHSRIQFTPDLLPSDITGVTIYDQRTGSWDFHKGPIFASIVLADEINRASPKTQSALLEVMEEAQVTVDGVRRETGRPFMVIATQNPVEQAGTYRLPEAQLDRFLMKTSDGLPEPGGAAPTSSCRARPHPDRSQEPWSAVVASSVGCRLHGGPGGQQPHRELGRWTTSGALVRGRRAQPTPRPAWACRPVAPSAMAAGRPRVGGRPGPQLRPARRRQGPRRASCGPTAWSWTPTPSSAEPRARASSSVRWERSPPRS